MVQLIKLDLYYIDVRRYREDGKRRNLRVFE